MENFHSQDEVYKDLHNFVTGGLVVDTLNKSESQQKLDDKNLINNLIRQARFQNSSSPPPPKIKKNNVESNVIKVTGVTLGVDESND